MEMAMVNSYLLYRKSMKIQNAKALSHYNYRLNIIKNLVKHYYLSKTKLDEQFYFD